MLADTPSELAKQYSVAVAASSGCVAVAGSANNLDQPW